MEDGRKAFEAMIDRAKECAVNGGAAIYPLIQDWYHAGAWLPTEQHETVTAMLKRLDDEQVKKMDRADLGDLTGAWVDAGKPGLPKPVDPYGPEITVDTGGRCPVEGDEVVSWYVVSLDKWSEFRADRIAWHVPRTFRRILADHPGDSYWHGKLETIPKSGRVDLNIRDWVVNYSRNAGRCMAYSMASELEPGETFRRWLKGDA